MNNTLVFLVFVSTLVYGVPDKPALASCGERLSTAVQESRPGRLWQRWKIQSRYGEAWTRGLKELAGYRQLAEKLKAKGIDSSQEHIPELFNLSLKLLEHARRSIWDQNIEVRERLFLTDLFLGELFSFKKEKRVSYRYWVGLGLRLSILMTPSRERTPFGEDLLGVELTQSEKWKTHGGFEEAIASVQKHQEIELAESLNRNNFLENHLNLFPELILFPVPFRPGLVTFSRALAQGIHLVELSPGTNVQDGYFPNLSFFENLTSARFFVGDPSLIHELGVLLPNFEKRVARFDVEKAKKAELAFYLSLREEIFSKTRLRNPVNLLEEAQKEWWVDYSILSDRAYSPFLRDKLDRSSEFEMEDYFFESFQSLSETMLE